MKLRLVRIKGETYIYCMNGTILKASTEETQRFVLSFKRPNQFKGTDGYWNKGVSDMECAFGETLAYVDDTYKLIILNESIFNGILKTNVKYISAAEYADLHGKGKAIVKRKCSEGRILGAYKTSSGWLIPENTPYPEDRRSEQSKK